MRAQSVCILQLQVKVQTSPGFAKGLSDGMPKFIQQEGVAGYAGALRSRLSACLCCLTEGQIWLCPRYDVIWAHSSVLAQVVEGHHTIVGTTNPLHYDEVR